MPIKDNREYRTMELRKAVPAEGEEKNYIVEGYATTFGDVYELYRDGKYIVKETIDRNAFNETDMSDVVFLLNHTGRVYARTRNGSVQLSIDDHGIKSVVDLGLTSSARSVYEDIDTGLYDQMSFAFTVENDSYEEEELDNGDVVLTRTILSVGKMYDVSAVDFPANPYTAISSRSKESIDGEIERFETERSRREEYRAKSEAIIARLKTIKEEKTDD